MTALRPAWLTERPIAHRGLHDRAKWIIENTPRAARAAIARNYAIECDIQLSSDGEAMVFHDFQLERLTDSSGRVDSMTARALSQISLRGSDDVITTLMRLLELVDARVPLIVEIKSDFSGDMRLAERAARIIATYIGPVALKSFDPQIMTHLRYNRTALGITQVPLGMIAEARYAHEEWNFLPADEKFSLANFLHWQNTQPDFLSWHVNDLPHAVPNLCRTALGVPVMTWTVRTREQRDRAIMWADQMI